MNFNRMTKKDLIGKCKELNLKYSNKTKEELVLVLSNNTIIRESNIVDEDTSLKFVDLFCGIGGFHTAMKSFNAKCVMACDIDDKCREVYQENYGILPQKDIRKIDETKIEDFDVLCAGFPCFVAGTKVLTKNGYKKIEDVHHLDNLLTHEGNYKKINNFQSKIYEGILYKIETHHNSNSIICTEEHPFFTRFKNKFNTFETPKWVTAKDLTYNHYLGMVKNKLDVVPYFNYVKDNIEYNFLLNLSSEWFLMGYYICHGWISNNDTFEISFLINNRIVLKKLKEILPLQKEKQSVFSAITKLFKSNDDTYTIYKCANYKWYDILRNFNNFNNHYMFTEIPEWVHNAPVHLIKEFLSGYEYGSTGSMYLSSYILALGLQRLYLKINITVALQTNNYDNVFIIHKNNQYDIKHNLLSFIDGDYIWYSICNISSSYVEDVPVFNFEVDEDNSYVVENIIVHNCQSFSNAGCKGSLKDKRGTLFEDILRIASAKKPRFMFLENVKHIKKIDDGKAFSHILKRIGETGYCVQHFELSPHQLGIPQHRERVIFVCIREDIYNADKSIDLQIDSSMCDDMNLSSILETSVDDKYKIESDVMNVLDAWNEIIQEFDVGQSLSPTIMCNEFYKSYTDEEYRKLPAWKKEYIAKNKPLYTKYKDKWDIWYNKNKDILSKKEIYGKLEWQTGKKKENDSIWNYFIQLRQSGIRVKKADYFPTLVAIVQTPIYAKEKRYITPRECARLQSFPDDFKMHKKDSVAYKQFGNAVNVTVVRHVINKTLTTYDVCSGSC
jgi:DNA (cytosine-5)-methyltransferase 1